MPVYVCVRVCFIEFFYSFHLIVSQFPLKKLITVQGTHWAFSRGVDFHVFIILNTIVSSSSSGSSSTSSGSKP